MAKSDKKSARASKTPAARRAPVARPPASSEPPSPEEAAAYLEALVKSGQAVPVTPGEPLPAGATHAIVKGDDGQPRAVRRRFSIS